MTEIIRSQGAKDPSQEVYREMVAQASRRTNITATVLKAFFIGGSICLLGEIIRQALLRAGVPQDDSAAWTSVLLVFLSALLTGFGFYQKLAKHGGAGTLVPITGFANAVASAAVEAKTEGFILGVGTKIFTIAGPVILYGTAASVVYGVIYYFFGR
ncbi:MAG: SpoVA/SpoVAEb family sporulation membrane protein [Oscillospiraceae bacterium]|nr:SpoVA/SpoVAEb family sporulation membrane protein [Oscillospiraceae bacterium]